MSIADALSDAVELIDHYLTNEPDVYPPHSQLTHRIRLVRKEMDEIRAILDREPDATQH